MKPVTVMHGPYDNDEDYDFESGYLVAPGCAMYYSVKYDQMWIDEVKPVPNLPNTYMSDIGLVLTEQTNDIAAVFRILSELTAIEFILKYLLRCADIEMFPDGPPKFTA
ncbi:hypothetical protein ACFQZE_11700 [Paenibacillus sp. GCM10027627]|uniref:hypothetical protein n=1 Tax=unclassified Paenibacillus TaxID=185978 RepID=UPI00362A8FDD